MVERWTGTNSNTRRRRFVAAAAGLALVTTAAEARTRWRDWRGPETACTVAKSSSTTLAGTIALEADPALPPHLLAAAIELWSACANYGSGFPRLVAGADGTRVIRIEPANGTEGRRCGSFAASTIRLYGVARWSDRVMPCLPLERILAHEIGHALGLADAPALPSCRDHIMAPVFESRDVGRRVQPSECQAVGQHWLTPEEMNAQERLVDEWTRNQPPTEEDP